MTIKPVAPEITETAVEKAIKPVATEIAVEKANGHVKETENSVKTNESVVKQTAANTVNKTAEPKFTAAKSEQVLYSIPKRSVFTVPVQTSETPKLQIQKSVVNARQRQNTKQETARNGNGGPKDAAKKPLIADVDALQRQIAVFKVGDVAYAEKTPETPVIKQTFDGISENIKLGKDEFNIKLNPDGMGEISVKIVKTDGKLVVSMTAQRPETAKILNAQLNTLKSILSGRNAVVEKVETVRKTADVFVRAGAIESLNSSRTSFASNAVQSADVNIAVTPAEQPQQSNGQERQYSENRRTGGETNQQQSRDSGQRSRRQYYDPADLQPQEPETREEISDFVDWYRTRSAVNL